MAEFERLHAGNSEVQEKQSVAFDFAQTATVGLAATGVLTGLMVNQTSTASGSVILGAGAGVVGSTVGAGVSEGINPGDVTFDVFTANPVGGLPRNDIMVWDSVTRQFGAVIGTPNASPSDPTVANTKLPLGRLRHAASATTIPLAKIDDLRTFTALRGVPVQVLNQAARDALFKYDGLRVYRLDLHLVETWNGSRWAGAPQVYTPTVTGITQGNGTVTGRYVEQGKTVTGTIMFQIGSTSVMSGVATFSLPFTPVNIPNGLPVLVTFFDAGNTWFPGAGVISGALVYVGANTSGPMTPLTSTTPINWTPGDAIIVYYAIEIA